MAPSWGAFWSASRCLRERAAHTKAWSVAQGVMARPQRAQGLLGQRRQALGDGGQGGRVLSGGIDPRFPTSQHNAIGQQGSSGGLAMPILLGEQHEGQHAS